MRFVDLSHEIVPGMKTFPGLPGPIVTDFLSREESRSKYADGTEFQIGRIELVANTGTYLDSPSHRYEDGADLSQLPLELIADLEGVVVPVGEDVTRIGLEVLASVDVENRAVLFATGWSSRWATEAYFADHPHLIGETAMALVERGAALVGIDSLNIDGTADGTRPVHSVLLEHSIPIVEHLTNLGEIGSEPFRFFAVPPKFRGMGTFPVRAFAVVES